MEPNDVARRYSNLPGYRLVDFVRVGLPVFFVTFDAFTISSKRIPIVDEFILRCIEKGLDKPRDLAGFLGLEEPFTAKRLGGIFATDHIGYGPSDDDEPIVSLTSKGREAVSKAMIIQPRRQTLNVAVDGITRRSLSGGRVDLLKPRDIRAFGLKEIRAFPNRAPDLDELLALDLKAARPNRKREETVERVLSIAKLVRRHRWFREAVMLVYHAETGSDVQVRFAVDGRPYPEMDDAFRSADGVKEMKIAEQIAASKIAITEAAEASGASHLFVKASLATKETREGVRPAILKLARLDQDSNDAASRAQTTSELKELAKIKDELKKIEAEKLLLEQQVASVTVRYLEVHEHRPLFEKALLEAKERLLIVSPWINDSVMSTVRLQRIEALVRRGVQVYIGYGIGGNEERRPAGEGQTAVRHLERLARFNLNFTLCRLGDTHAKILVVDRAYVVVGSFNWMSFEGDSKRHFREEVSSYCTIAESVDEMFDRYMTRFQSKE